MLENKHITLIENLSWLSENKELTVTSLLPAKNKLHHEMKWNWNIPVNNLPVKQKFSPHSVFMLD